MARGVVLATAAAVAALLATSAVAAPSRPKVALSPLESGVLAQLNQVRTQHGLGRLRLSFELYAAARAHSLEMAQDGYFGHESADGTSFSQRMKGFYSSSPGSYWSVGENLLWSSPDVSPAQALKLWMKSPEHRNNILTARWKQIGVSAVHVSAAPGVFGGMDVTIVTTDFGVRR